MPTTFTEAVGAAMTRIEGREKVTGRAQYAFEHRLEGMAYGWIVQATVAKGRVRGVDTEAALAVAGAVAVLWHDNAPRVASHDDRELAVLQTPEVAYRGQVVAVAIADSIEAAREAADAVRVDYETAPHDVV
ncbi:MAG TPA: hypothetical protein VK510_11895, partial [Solirubrobacteraceae bacterium]|nr:hypothetical protein [Solirubrobacteraceae bacterium]